MILLLVSFAFCLKPIYFVAGFGDSSIYFPLKSSIHKDCPPGINNILIQKANKYNIHSMSNYTKCIAKLLQVQYNKKVIYLPEMQVDNIIIGNNSICTDIFNKIIGKMIDFGYFYNINYFTVDYNYFLHPVTSYDVYDKLKRKIEQDYTHNGEKAIFISYDQGTSFTSIFLSNYSRLEWVKQYIDSVIFLDPTFAGLSTISHLYSQSLYPFISNDEFIKSLMKMPGLHIRLPNYAIYENFSINYENKIYPFNASHVFEFLKEHGKVDDESELIFKAEAEKYLKVPVPEPPIPSLIIFNDVKSQTVNRQLITFFNDSKNEPFSPEGSLYACAKWRTVKCLSIHPDRNQSSILQSQQATDAIIDHIKERNLNKDFKKINRETIYKDNKEMIHKDNNNKVKKDGREAIYKDNNEMINKDNNNKVKENSREAIYKDNNEMINKDKNNKVKENSREAIYKDKNNKVKENSREAIYKDNNEMINKDKNKKVNQEMFNKEKVINADNVISFTEVMGNFSDEGYVNSHMVDSAKFRFSAPSGHKNYQLSYAFDSNPNTLYVSSVANSDTFNNRLSINFTKSVTLEAILYDPKYSTDGDTGTFQGFPNVVNVYSSIGNEPLTLKATFTGNPVYQWTRIQYVFPDMIECDKLILEFANVTKQTIVGDTNSLVICNLFFIQHYDKEPSSIASISGKYSNNGYFNKCVISSSEFTYSAPTGMINHRISDAFDGNESTYYISGIDNTNIFYNTIIINFTKTVILEAFIYVPVFNTNGNTRIFHGFPTVLNVYSSIGNNNFTLVTTFIGIPLHTWNKVQFVFPEIIECDKLKLEFVDVTYQFIVGNSKSPVIEDLYLIRYLKTYQINEVTGKNKINGYVYSANVGQSKFDFSGQEGMPNYPLNNAFDGTPDTCYISSISNNATYSNKIAIEFTETVALEAMLYDPFYDDELMIHGCPTILYIYSSTGNETLSLNYIFIGDSLYEGARLQFVFPEIIECDKIVLEFGDVTEQTVFGNSKSPIICNLFFIQKVETTYFTEASKDYLDNNYVSLHMIDLSKFTCDAPEGVINYPLSNAFDGNSSTFYISSISNNYTYYNNISISFSESVFLEALLYDPSYFTFSNKREFQGFPTGIRVYVSNNEQLLSLNTIFIGEPVYPWTRIQFVFPIIIECDKLVLEFVDVSKQGLFNNQSNPTIAGLYFISPNISTIQPSMPTPIYIADLCEPGSRCDYNGKEGEQICVIINSSGFKNIVNSDDGGAIRITNAGIICQEMSFDDCQSKEGGGGALYIDSSHIVDIEKVDFVNCKANFGGGIYVYSTSNDERVKIIECSFTSCQSLSDASNASTGGSAIYITSRMSIITDCKFINNLESQVKIYNSFVRQNGAILEHRKQPRNDVKYCRFEIGKHSKSSLFYVGGPDGVNCFVKSSVFVGQIHGRNYHIDGELLSKFAPKIVVDFCKFSTDHSHSINVKSSNDYCVFQLQKQFFNYNEAKETNKIEIFTFSIIILAAVIVIVIIFIFKKKMDSSNMEILAS